MAVMETQIVLDVNGVGYLVNVPKINGLNLNQEVELHTHLAVRENAMDLYGFGTDDELKIFETLLTIPKIGPKSALQILSQADINLLYTAVQNDDPSHLSKLSGIGKKSAEKIVAGLKDKLDIEEWNSNFPNSSDLIQSDYASDTVDALITLGYPQVEARRVVLEITSTESDIKSSTEALKLALRILSK